MRVKLNRFFIFLASLSLNASIYAKDINIAIIDTGIDPTNQIFEGRLFVGKSPATFDNYGVDFSKGAQNLSSPIDQHGHGTHIAGIIAKYAPEAKLHILKYYNPMASGEENLKSTIEALRYAINLNVEIINYSSGGPEASIEEKRLFDLAEKKGIVIVSAAGNEGNNIDRFGHEFFPASYHHKNIITVGSHDKSFTPLKSSNYGARSVDIFAPGERILSTLPNNRQGYLTGTSQATAFVSAKVATIMKKFNKFSPVMIKNKLFSNSIVKKKLRGLCSTGKILNLENQGNEINHSLVMQN